MDGADARALRGGHAEDGGHRTADDRVPAALPDPGLRRQPEGRLRVGRGLAHIPDHAQHPGPRLPQEGEGVGQHDGRQRRERQQPPDRGYRAVIELCFSDKKKTSIRVCVRKCFV